MNRFEDSWENGELIVKEIAEDGHVTRLHAKKGSNVIVLDDTIKIEFSTELLNVFLESFYERGVGTLGYLEESEKLNYDSGYEDGVQHGYEERDSEIGDE